MWATEGQPFCSIRPRDLLEQAPSASQPEPKLTSRLHFQQVPPFITRQGCWRWWEGGYSRGPVTGQCVCPSPLLFSSPQAAENIGLCRRQQPHSSLTTLTMEFQIYSGEERPAPLYCSLAPSPLSLAPSHSAFFSSVSPSLLDCPPSSLTLLPPGSPSPLSPQWGIIPPTLFHQSWASVWAVLIAEKK